MSDEQLKNPVTAPTLKALTMVRGSRRPMLCHPIPQAKGDGGECWTGKRDSHRLQSKVAAPETETEAERESEKELFLE